MSKRLHGTGSITPLPDGRFWVRGPRPRRLTLGYPATREAAEDLLENGRVILTTSKHTGRTFAKVAESVLDDREKGGIRGIDQERARFELHLATACFAEKPIDAVRATDIAEWLRAMSRKQAKDRRGARPLSRATIQRALALASVVFDASGPQGTGLVDSNPCRGMKVPGKTNRTEEPWTFLTLEEQRAIRACEDIAPEDRRAILFAIGTGLRQGEQFNLELRDVFAADDEKEPRVVVRFGSKNLPPKNGKIRTVPLFGMALEAAKEQIAARGKTMNPERLLFPSPTGERMPTGKPLGNGVFVAVERGATHAFKKPWYARVTKGATHKYVDRFDLVLAKAGITRSVRWHDLRHTCASSLIGGFWGQPWTLEEVKDMLGHSSILVTQRYAHLGETALKKAARKVAPMGGGLVRTGPGAQRPAARKSNDLDGVSREGLEPSAYGLKGPSVVELLRALAGENASDNPTASHLAEALANELEGASS